MKDLIQLLDLCHRASFNKPWRIFYFIVKGSTSIYYRCRFFVGIIGNLASDAAFVLIPPIAGIIFYATDRNPLAGISVGFVAVEVGFTANIFIAGTDVLLASVTNEVLKSVSDVQITSAANWHFMLISVPFLTILGTFITEK